MNDTILRVCLASTSKNPYHIFKTLIEQPLCRIHGPEHHIIVGSSLLIAYKNAGGDIDLKSALMEIGQVGGPRCCKRNSYIAISEAVRFAKEELGVTMELGPISCTTFQSNSQCIGDRCPFWPGK